MSAHFSSFTPEAMRAFGQELRAGFQRRVELLEQNREHTSAMLARFRNDQCEAEERRRRRAMREADARRLFASELRSDVHALLGRFELSRGERAGEIEEMAGELRAARDAFRNRPGRPRGSFFRQRSGRQQSR